LRGVRQLMPTNCLQIIRPLRWVGGCEFEPRNSSDRGETGLISGFS
jgi:hypothetical protein